MTGQSDRNDDDRKQHDVVETAFELERLARLGEMSRRRSSPRSNTGSVEASAAPRIVARAGVMPSSHHAASAVSAAQRIVPGPSMRNARPAVASDFFCVESYSVSK